MAVRPRLRIPDQYHQWLETLISLDDATSAKLVAVLSKTEPTLLRDDFVAQAAPQIGLPTNQTEGIIELLTVLYLARMDLDLSLSEFIDALINAINELPAGTLSIPDKEVGRFRTRLSKLLSLDRTLGVVSKAGFLLSQHSQVYLDARIFTDFRPVFESDAVRPPVAGLIIHKLQITYRHANRQDEIIVAMDPDDVQDLIKVLQRAVTKAKSLEASLKGTSLRVLGDT